MRVFSWNVNGIRAVINKGEFAKFIDKYRPDILCLQETKAKVGQAEIDLPEYEEYWNSAERAGYSGTAIFVKDNVSPTATSSNWIPDQVRDDILGRSDLRDNSIGSDPIVVKNTSIGSDPIELRDGYGDLLSEGRITTVEFKEFFIVSVYTPNSKDDLSRLEIRERWDAAFLDYVKELHKTKPVIFCGDLNVAHREIDLARPKENVGKHGFTDEERAGFTKYLDAGFVDVFRKIHGDEPDQYTWWTFRANARARNVGWRIDYFLATADIANRIVAADIHPEQMGSDHCPISIELEM